MCRGGFCLRSYKTDGELSAPGKQLAAFQEEKGRLASRGQWRSGFTLVGIAGVFRILDSRKTEATRT